MKNTFKTGILAIVIAIAASACGGGHSNHPGDSLKTDTAALNDTTQKAPVAGANGAASAVDSGMDHSGSGGTDTIKKP